MITAIFMGFLSALAILVVMARLDLRKFVGYPIITDILCTFLFTVLFAGTLTGMLCAVIAALTVSFCIWAIRFIYGFKRYNFRSGWTYYPPRCLTVRRG